MPANRVSWMREGEEHSTMTPTAVWTKIARDAEAGRRAALRALPELPASVSLEGFVRCAADPGPMRPYKYFPDTARHMLETLRAACGSAASRAFLRAALGHAVSTFVKDGRYRRLPPLCAHFHTRQLERIATDTDVDAAWLDLDSDLFQKEFGIASMRLYAAGSNLVDYRCGVPRSVIWREGATKAFGHLLFMRRLGGFRPYFQGHLHAFNPVPLDAAGRDDFYRCCAELYTLHPECLGMFCSSWYYDPALDHVSPWLAYLRTVPLAGGARLFRVGESPEAVANATATSRTRRRCYEEGRYLPCNHLFVWGRQAHTAWARAHPRRGPEPPVSGQ